jgi:hypothetical protein
MVVSPPSAVAYLFSMQRYESDLQLGSQQSGIARHGATIPRDVPNRSDTVTKFAVDRCAGASGYALRLRAAPDSAG